MPSISITPPTKSRPYEALKEIDELIETAHLALFVNKDNDAEVLNLQKQIYALDQARDALVIQKSQKETDPFVAALRIALNNDGDIPEISKQEYNYLTRSLHRAPPPRTARVYSVSWDDELFFNPYNSFNIIVLEPTYKANYVVREAFEMSIRDGNISKEEAAILKDLVG